MYSQIIFRYLTSRLSRLKSARCWFLISFKNQFQTMNWLRDKCKCKYAEETFYTTRILPTFYIFIIFFGLLGNSAVLYLTNQLKRKRTVVDTYVRNLAIAGNEWAYFVIETFVKSPKILLEWYFILWWDPRTACKSNFLNISTVVKLKEVELIKDQIRSISPVRFDPISCKFWTFSSRL